jgi:hypothetical protein
VDTREERRFRLDRIAAAEVVEPTP